MVFVTFVSVRYNSASSWMIQLCGSMISVLLNELEIGYKDPKSAGDLSVPSAVRLICVIHVVC